MIKLLQFQTGSYDTVLAKFWMWNVLCHISSNATFRCCSSILASLPCWVV